MCVSVHSSMDELYDVRRALSWHDGAHGCGSFMAEVKAVEILIVGNEILNGDIQDTNTYYLPLSFVQADCLSCLASYEIVAP